MSDKRDAVQKFNDATEYDNHWKPTCTTCAGDHVTAKCPKRVAPSAETREWYLKNERLFWEYDSASGVSYRDVPKMLEAYHAYRTCASPAAPSCDEKDAVAAETARECISCHQSNEFLFRVIIDGHTFYYHGSRDCKTPHVDMLKTIARAYHSKMLKKAPPAATNCCTATEVEAARNPKKSLEERAQEAAEAHIVIRSGEYLEVFWGDLALTQGEEWERPRLEELCKQFNERLSRIGGAD